MNTLQNRIKSTRLEQGLSQAQLAKVTGVSQPTVANWENGSHIPRQKALEKIGTALGVESNWLLSGNYADAHNNVHDYLSRPIRHVPIFRWPDAVEDLFSGHPAGYLTYPSDSPHSVALVAQSTPSSRQKIWIIDQDLSPSSHTSMCLWATENEVTLGPSTEKPTDGKPVGYLKAEITVY